MKRNVFISLLNKYQHSSPNKATSGSAGSVLAPVFLLCTFLFRRRTEQIEMHTELHMWESVELTSVINESILPGFAVSERLYVFGHKQGTRPQDDRPEMFGSHQFLTLGSWYCVGLFQKKNCEHSWKLSVCASCAQSLPWQQKELCSNQSIQLGVESVRKAALEGRRPCKTKDLLMTEVTN